METRKPAAGAPNMTSDGLRDAPSTLPHANSATNFPSARLGKDTAPQASQFVAPHKPE
jgi:hypothetical protein